MILCRSAEVVEIATMLYDVAPNGEIGTAGQPLGIP